MNGAVLFVMAVWLVLMISTVASTWWFSQPVFTPTVSTVAVMLIAALKVWLVMAYFMELRGAPRPWQIAGAVWVIAALCPVMFFYLL